MPFPVEADLAGHRVRIHLKGDVCHIVRDRMAIRSFPCVLDPTKRERLQGARIPRESSGREHRDGGQRIHVGLAHRRKVVDFEMTGRAYVS